MKTKATLLFEKQEYATIVSTDGKIPENPEKNSTMVICGDGAYLLRKNEIGRFVRKTNSVTMPAIPDGPGEGDFSLSLPKIPDDILKMQVCFYRRVMLRHNDAEAYTMILWDRETKQYMVVCPKQKISKGNVQYDLGQEWSPERYLPVVSCHSHNSMGSFFSGTDDADEKGDMCYMVMGNLHKPNPTFRIRASVAGAQIKFLELDELFTMNEEEWKANTPEWLASNECVPEEWMSKLNVDANYVNIHVLQGGSPRSPFRYGTFEPDGGYTASKWPTTQGKFEQLSFFEGAKGNEAAVGRTALRTAAQKFILDLRRETVTDALSNLLDNIIDAGYVEELAIAFSDVEDVMALPDMEDPFTTEMNLDLDDGSNASWDTVNEFVERMNMLNKG